MNKRLLIILLIIVSLFLVGSLIYFYIFFNKIIIYNKASTYSIKFTNTEKYLQFYNKVSNWGLFNPEGIVVINRNSYDNRLENKTISRLVIITEQTPQDTAPFVLKKGETPVASYSFDVANNIGHIRLYIDAKAFKRLSTDKRQPYLNQEILEAVVYATQRGYDDYLDRSKKIYAELKTADINYFAFEKI